jgi:cytoskeletal protein RodZ
MAELGNTLSRARRARGITLEDAERDTHVSRRYLQALEMDDFTIFPAPVYARGFLRTYSRYLGLNPEELIRIFPNNDLTVDISPLPTVTRPPAQVVNVNWLVAGIVSIFLLGAGLLLLRGGDDPAAVPGPQGAATVVSGVPNNGVPAPQTTGSNAAPVQGKPITAARPGQLPDFVAADVPSALSILTANQIGYVIIEVPDRATPKGIVISQTPKAGARTNDESAVTLVVSAGPPPAN